MFKYSLASLAAYSATSIELQSRAQLQLGSEIEALVEQEVYSDMSTDPCAFPDVKQFNTPEYLAQSASCKKRQIWQNVMKDKRINRWFAGIDLLSLFTQDMNLSFDHKGDTMPDDRLKVTHPRGVTLKISYLPTAD